jgi:hypothetical protein
MTAPPSPAKLRRLVTEAARSAADLGLVAIELEVDGVRVRVERAMLGLPRATIELEKAQRHDPTAAAILSSLADHLADQAAIEDIRKRLGPA